MTKYHFFFTVTRPKKLFTVVKKGFGLCTLSMWSYSVMVITQDSESCDPGSSPGRTLVLLFFWLETDGVELAKVTQCLNMPGCPRGPRGQT